VVKFVLGLALMAGGVSAAVWKLLIAKQWVEDIEYEGNVRAERALEELDDEADIDVDVGVGGNGNGNGKKQGKGKKK
jgi:hypothetical protein